MDTKVVRFKRNSDVFNARIDDELVMMSIEDGRYYGLNSVGSSIWDKLSDSISIEQLVAAICSDFEVAERQCRRDVESFLDALETKGLVKRV